MTCHIEVRPGAYHDSVSLMRVSNTVAAGEGVQAALVAMATQPNLDLLTGMGFTPPDGAGPNDLVAAIRTDSDTALAAARHTLDEALENVAGPSRTSTGPGAAPEPRTIESAAIRSGARVAMVSVPGNHAFVEAMDALQAGLSVVVFSDNVPVEHEIRLKKEAAARDLLVMGPDCGTAVIGGVGFGFANVVRPGPVGLVAASGTGAQELMALLDAGGVGISHCLGVGGRDLSAEVAGRSTRQAMVALDADPATKLIAVVSKPPESGVADDVRGFAEKLSTPTHFVMLGPGEPDLTAAATDVVAVARGERTGSGADTTRWPYWPAATGAAPVARTGALRGLFCGGTLCDEAMAIASGTLGPIYSNAPLYPEWALCDDLRAADTGAHLMIDFGDDRLTRGRPHPVIDPAPRLNRFAEEAADPQTAAVLLDILLGYGAHPDPAADLTGAIRGLRDGGKSVPVVVSLVGTAGDPQRLHAQAEALAAAGAEVFLSNAAATRRAVDLVT